jgi:hypothetical protein
MTRGGQVYAAVLEGRLREPFSRDDLRRGCPGWPEGIYRAFLPQHSIGNKHGNTELFVRIAPGLYRLNRPRTERPQAG